MNFLHGEEDKRQNFDMAGLTQDLLDLFRSDGVEDVSASSMSTFARTELWLQSATSEADLRVLVLYNGNIIISRVQVNHPRTGVFTKIMACIEKACTSLHGECIIISGVCTKEMVRWCDKNLYTPVDCICFDSDGVIMGDYRKSMHYREEKPSDGGEDETPGVGDQPEDPDSWTCDDSIYSGSQQTSDEEVVTDAQR